MKRNKLIILSLGAVATAAATAEESAPVTRSFVPEPLAVMQSEGEEVDLFTGGLHLRYDDVKIPGNGGMDIVVTRTYSSNSVRAENYTIKSVSPSYVYENSGLGVGWNMMAAPRLVIRAEKKCEPHVMPNQPPVCTYVRPDSLERLCTGQLPNKFDSAYAMHVVLPEGRQMLLYGKAPGVVVSKEGWRATCTNWIVTLSDPSGIKYTLESAGRNADGTVKVPTPPGPFRTGWNPNTFNHYVVLVTIRKEDANGNWLTYKYGPHRLGLSRIDASDGRWVEFDYADSLSLGAPQLSAIRTQSGAVWNYSHVAFPSSYWFGTAAPWQKFYALEKVTLPTRDTLTYTYHLEPYTWKAGNFAGSARLKSRSDLYGGVVTYDYTYSGYAYTFGGPNWSETDEALSFRVARTTRADGTVQYTYTKGRAGEFDTTTVNDGQSATVYKYIGPGYYITDPKQSVWTENLWRVGLLVEKQTGTIQVEKFQYVPFEVSPYPVHIGPGVEPQADTKVWAARMSVHEIVRDNQTYVTERSNWSPYGHPQTIVERGPNGGSRTTTITYYDDPSKWIIGKVKDESFTGGSTQRTFDTNGNLTSHSVDGVLTSFRYDASGNVSSKTYPRGLEHRYSNYKRGVPQRVEEPEGVVITRVVDDAGNVVSETNGAGKTTSWTYDGLRRPTSVAPPKGNPVSIVYKGRIATATRGALIEEKEFDGYGRLIRLSLGGIDTHFRYDLRGRRLFQSNPGASSPGTSFAYDALDRPVLQVNPDSTSIKTSYGPGSKSVTDERGKTWTYSYRSYGDPAKKFLMQLAAPESSASLSFERNGRDLITSISQEGIKRSYGYNANYFLTSETHPETGVTTFGRDAAGNMTSKAVGSSGVTTFTYDGRNRLRAINYPQGTPSISFAYSKTDKLESASSAGGVRSMSWDDNGNLAAEALLVDGIAFTATYLYNENDHLAAIFYPRSNRAVMYEPDVLGRPTQASGFVNSVTYWPSGHVKQIAYANGTVSQYGQNSRMWPNSFQTLKTGGAGYVNTAYQYDGAGNVTNIDDTWDASFNRILGYDGIGRLTHAQGPWGNGAINYSGTGNITSQVFGGIGLYYTYDSSNRLTQVSGVRAGVIGYDLRGNVSSGLGMSYQYDDAPNLRCVNCGNAAQKVEYTYDGLNHRSTVTKGGVKSYEMVSILGNQLIEFTPSQGGKLVEYIYLGNKRVAEQVTP